jgi:predicted nuclease of restriction endonuclease-like (RecB) superfamily
MTKAHEREIEHALVRHVTEFLLELGAGFAFVGRQVLLDVAATTSSSTCCSTTSSCAATW